MEHIDSIHKAIGSISAAQVVQQMPDFNYSEIVKLVVQIVIGIGTLISIFRGKKDKTTSQ